MLRGIALIVCLVVRLAVPRSAQATVVGSGESQSLLGWADDGETWAVLRDMAGTQTIAVIWRGKIVLQICNRKDKAYGPMGEQIANPCKKGRRMVAVNIRPSKNHSGLLRINIATHRALKRFKLKPVSATWRKAFNKRFLLKHGPYGPRPTGQGQCSQGWSLIRRADNKRVRHDTFAGCVRTRGGYLSANGKYALVKFSSSTYVVQGGMGGYRSQTAYAWVKL